MALLPGYRYLEVGETIPAGAMCDHGDAVPARETVRAGEQVSSDPHFYMVPVAKPRRIKSYMPPGTSLEAHKSQKDKAPADVSKILAYIIRGDRSKGATCDEIEVALSLSHQTASARVRDLFKAGSIRDSGIRRNTRTGRKATVWGAATA